MDSITLSEIKNYAKSAINELSNPLHTFDHLERVGCNAVWIVKALEIENKIDLNLLQAACYLHDIPINISQKNFLGAVGKHLFEKEIIKKNLPGILDRFKLSKEEYKIIFEAILNHPFSIPYKHLNEDQNNYVKILQDSDSLDYFSFRREESLREAKNKSLYHFLLQKFSGPYFVFGRKNIHSFLNFPKVAKKYVFLK